MPDAILTGVTGCIRAHNQAVRAAKASYEDHLATCKDQLKADLALCDALPALDQPQCNQMAMQRYQQCVQAAQALRNAEIQQADAQLAFCLSQIPLR